MGLYNNPDEIAMAVIDPNLAASAVNSAVTKGFSLPVPISGADVSSQGFNSSVDLLNGGAFEVNSWATHKTYAFGWGQSESPKVASKLSALRNGSYGRGTIHFADPMYYKTNILHKFLADPSMAEGGEAPVLMNPDYVSPYFSDTPANDLDLPTRQVTYMRPASPSGTSYGTMAGRFYIPIPPGHTCTTGMIGERVSGTPGMVLYRQDGLVTQTYSSLPIPISAGVVTNSAIHNPTSEVKVLAGSIIISAGSSLTINGVTARMFGPGEPVTHEGPWYSGEGHSGCRFEGAVSLANYNGVGEGQVSLSATFKETGAWE